MSDKKNDLKEKAGGKAFKKIDKTSKYVPDRKTRSPFGTQPSSLKKSDKELVGDLGGLDDFDDLDESDFGVIREKSGSEAKSAQVKALPDRGKGEDSSVDPVDNAPFAEADDPDAEKEEPVESVVKAVTKAVVVTPRVAKVQPVRLDPLKVYLPKVAEVPAEVPFGEAVSSKVDENLEAAAQENSAKKLIEAEKSDRKKEADQGEGSEVSKAEEMEILPDVEKQENALSQSSDSSKAVSKWAFWKRPSRRDQQLARISDGYLEMVELVRAIRGQLESQNENNVILRDSLAHLPEAMKGLESFSQSQHTVGEALKEIHGQMQRYSSKDEKLAESMDGFNSTLKGMDRTSQATLDTFDRVQERMGDSDARMESLFQDVQESDEKVSETMVRLQRNMVTIQAIFLVCLLALIGVLIFVVLDEKSEAPVPSDRSVTESIKPSTPPVGVAPRDAREVTPPPPNR